MEQLETYEFSARGGSVSRYDFDTLFDGNIYRLKRGDDFDSNASIKSVRGYMHTQASKRGKSLRTQTEGDDIFVIQASDKKAKAKPAAKPKAKPAKRRSSKPKPKPAAKPAPGGINPAAFE